MKIYYCNICGALIKDEGKEIPICCGQEMIELNEFNSNGASEKHTPIYEINNNKNIVSVSDVEHPMSEEHYIMWIALETQNDIKKIDLSFNDKPYAEFELNNDESVVNAYAYCNLHGIWKSN